MRTACTRLFLESSETGGTSAVSLDRSRGSLETSPGPESVSARFGDGTKPGLSIVQSLTRRYPFRPSKNLPAASGRTNVMYLGLHHRAGPTLNAWASALTHNIPPKASKTGGERQGSREPSGNYSQDTGLSRKYRIPLSRGVNRGGRLWSMETGEL